MRCSAWSSLAISACSALLFAAPAAAHVTVSPPFVSAEGRGTLTLTAPNERNEPMTQFTATVPAGFRIVRAESVDAWQAHLHGVTAHWLGGRLAPGAEAKFALEVEAPAAPGPAVIEAVQLYPGGDTVRWPVALTVTPAATESSQNFGWTFVAVIVGFLATVIVVAVAWRRRERSLQEK